MPPPTSAVSVHIFLHTFIPDSNICTKLDFPPAFLRFPVHLKGTDGQPEKQMCVYQEIRTYGTAPVIVSLKATLGFPITQRQLYSLSILWNTKPRQSQTETQVRYIRFLWDGDRQWKKLLIWRFITSWDELFRLFRLNTSSVCSTMKNTGWPEPSKHDWVTLTLLNSASLSSTLSEPVPASRSPDAARPFLRWWFLCSRCRNELWRSDPLWWNGWCLWRICQGRSVWIQDTKESLMLLWLEC